PLAEIRDDFHRISYAANADAARAAYAAFERKWAKRCPGVVMSLREGGDELLTFFTFPKGQWKTLRTTNTIERLHEEFRRRVKTQGSLPSEDAALTLLFGLVVSGQSKLRRIDGGGKIDAVLNQHSVAAGRVAHFPRSVSGCRGRGPVPSTASARLREVADEKIPRD